jgi:hypothetical protein
VMKKWKWAQPCATALVRTRALFMLAMLAAAGSACTASVSAAPPPPVVVRSTGSAIVDWTINGTKDPAECQATGATTLNVSLYDSAAALVGQWVQDCTAFATTIDRLLPDTYTGQIDLLDRGGHPRTTMVDLTPFDVVAGRATTVAIDFPVSSFY